MKVFFCLWVSCCLAGFVRAELVSWNRFRGEDGAGVASVPGLPTKFSTSSELWKVDLAGVGHSSPVVHGDLVFLTAVPEEKPDHRQLRCYRLGNGKLAWAREYPFVANKKHKLNSYVSSTPVVTEEMVYVVWTEKASSEVRAWRHDGSKVWERRFGRFEAQHGSGSSPVMAGGVLVVSQENLNNESSYIYGLNPADGATVWKVARPCTKTPYATPAVREVNGKTEVVFCSTTFGVTAFDAASGKLSWEFNPNFQQRCVGSPVLMGDRVYVGTGQGGGGKESCIVALKDGKASKAYEIKRGLPYVPTGLYYDGRLFLVADGGVLACHEAATGKEIYRKRVTGPTYASPVCLNNRIYICSREGEVVVLKSDGSGELIDRSDLGEEIRATPTVAGKSLLIRTASKLYCFGGEKKL